MARTIKVRPSANLTLRDQDVALTEAELSRLSVFKADVALDGLEGDALAKAEAAIAKHADDIVKTLLQNKRTWVLRRYQAGEPICVQGDAGFTAYYLLTDEDVAAVIADHPSGDSTSAPTSSPSSSSSTVSPDADAMAGVHVLTDDAPPTKGRRRWRLWGGRTRRHTPPSDLRRRVVADRSAAGKLVRGLEPGEIFGEISCRYASPRSATIIAHRDGYVLEMMRHILDLVLKNKRVQADLEARRQERSLVSHLENLPIFLDVSAAERDSAEFQAAWAQLQAGVTLVEKKHDEPIFTEGEAYDGTLYVISVGQVRITQAAPGGERLLAYCGRGELLGEMGFLKSRTASTSGGPGDAESASSDDAADADGAATTDVDPAAEKDTPASSADDLPPDESQTKPSNEGKAAGGVSRSATCTAYFHPTRGQSRKGDEPRRVELIKIEQAAFEAFIQAVPSVLDTIDRIRADREKGDEVRSSQIGAGGVVLSGAFEQLGLFQGRRLMLIDLERCTRCDECVRACVNTHDDGRTRLLREGPRFGQYQIPATCRQCRDPVCLSGCPVASIHKGNGGQIVIEDWCIGCTKCAEQCPYDAINMFELGDAPALAASPGPATEGDYIEEAIAIKQAAVVCDQCQSLVDGQPSCVYACPHEAAGRVDAISFFGARNAAEPRKSAFEGRS